MPNNRKHTMKAIKGKEGLHPGSRKAAQITRVQLRAAKLKSQAKDRRVLATSKLFRPTFFLHALAGPQPLSLPSLRALISDVYLTRNDDRIAELLAERRPGRPKSKELVEMEEVKRRELAEWETGIEVPDLCHGPTTRLMYSWIDADTALTHAHVDMLRQVRLARATPDVVVVSRVGRVDEMGLGNGVEGEGEDWTVDGVGEGEEGDEGDEIVMDS